MDSDREQLIAKWYAAQAALESRKAELKSLVEAERALRDQVVKACFPKADEGTNTLALPLDWTLKAIVKVERDIDAATLKAVSDAMLERWPNQIPSLVRYKPELELKNYRKLTEEQRKLFDGTLVIKPRTPELELIAPKEKK